MNISRRTFFSLSATATWVGLSGLLPSVAHAAEWDRSDAYEEDLDANQSISLMTTSSIALLAVSDEMKYFGRYESHGNYDQGFSHGDGYHAMGYYQFDHRYVLQDFLTQCYYFDPTHYSMFEQFVGYDSSAFKASNAIRQNGAFTALGNALNAAWHAAYASYPTEFSQLQDSYAYQTYYLPGETYLRTRPSNDYYQSVDIRNRADCVKGLCWGLLNLFGSGGWRRFVGGLFNGTY